MADEKAIWKKIYQQAMAVCHPDRAPSHLQNFMEMKSKELNAAWQTEDFAKIRQVAVELGVKDAPPLTSSPPPSRERPTMEQWVRMVRDNESENVRQAIAAGMDVNAATKDGWTALTVAAFNGHVDCVRILLDAGANPNAADKKFPVLFRAVHGRNASVVKMLLDAGANPHATERLGHTALHFAANIGAVDCVKSLLDGGANPNAVIQLSEETALIQATGFGFLEVVEVLLAAGADPNLVNQNGYTAYGCAQRKKSVSIAMTLLLAGADPDLENQRKKPFMVRALNNAKVIGRVIKAMLG